MVEVALLTLFFSFFKCLFRRHGSFVVAGILLFLKSFEAFAGVFSLYPDQDIVIIEEKKERISKTSFRIGLTESFLYTQHFPCFFRLKQIPFLYSVLQAGMTCPWQNSTRNFSSFSFLPEKNFYSKQNQEALNLGFGNSFHLSQNNPNIFWIFSFHLNYKFWNSDASNSPEHLTSKELLHLWSHIFDSHFTAGLIRNKRSEKENSRAFSSYFYYQQSLPLAWRQLGGMRHTAAIEYKAIGASFRKKAFELFIFGFGLAYWTVTFDGIKFSGPLPDAYFALDI